MWYLQSNLVFGCKIEDQIRMSGEKLQVPEFVWKCVKKLESDPANIAAEGIYRVPGDAAKIQKLRIDIDQVRNETHNRLFIPCFMSKGSWESFEDCDDVHVIAGCLKLFFRELPQPLLSHALHDRLRAAATGRGGSGENVATSLSMITEELGLIERDTLEVVVRHLARVAEVANKMDVDNLALLFGQVLLWPDPSIPVDLSLITGKNISLDETLQNIGTFSESAKNVQVADAFIRFHKEIFPD